MAEPFRVVLPEIELIRLKEWGKIARSAGKLASFYETIDTINDNLTNKPLEWGDPNFHYPNLGLLACHAFHRMLRVYYAVDEKRHIVYVRKFLPVSGSGLED